MNDPQTGCNNAHPESLYDADEFMLTKEEEAVLSQIEEKHQASQCVQDPIPVSTPKRSPARKKRKRPASVERSPHVTPYLLRSTAKLSSCAVEMGHRPNIVNKGSAAPSAVNDTSASMEEGTSSAPSVAQPESLVPMNHAAPVIRQSSEGVRRSESIGPVNPQLHSSAVAFPQATANHGSFQQFAFQHYPLPYGPPTGFVFPNLQYRYNPPPGMPVDGPNPSSNVFSAQYVPPQGPQSVVQASMPNFQNLQAGMASCRSSESVDDIASPATKADTVLQNREQSLGTAAPSEVLAAKLSTPKKGQSNWGRLQRNEEADSDDLGDSPLRGSFDSESPTIGRLSNAARNELHLGYQDLDATVKRMSSRTGLPREQIIERWHSTKTRTVSSWNIYQGFFEERRDKELARLPVEERPLPGSVPDKSIISACYEKFKESKPDSCDEALRSWHRLRVMGNRGDMTFSKRAREFKKYVEKVETLIRQGSSLFGFESICVAVGGVLNQDQNLGQVVTSDAATDFFLECFRATDSVALGQMKAHVYHRISKCISDEDGSPMGPQLAPSSGPPASSHNPTTSKLKEGTPAVGEINVLAELKERFIAMAAKHNISITKGASLHWKGLPQIIAEAGCILVNWPEDVSFPCDEAGGKSTSKGIAILKLPARAQLLAAFDHPAFPLHIEKKYSSAVPKDQPVIIGVPPDSTSPHAFGRRKFLDGNQNEDRNGPPRLKPTATSSSGGANHAGHAFKSSRMAGRRPRPLKPVIEHISSSSDDDEPLVEGANEEEPETPKPPIKRTRRSDNEPVDSPYLSSHDGSPQYSGSDREAVVSKRSPLNLRSKALMKNIGRPKIDVTKQPIGLKTRAPAMSSAVQEATAADILAEKLFGTRGTIAEPPPQVLPQQEQGLAPLQRPPPSSPCQPFLGMPPPNQAHHGLPPPPLPHPGMAQQQRSHLMQNLTHAPPGPGYADGHFPPYPNAPAMPPYSHLPHPHAPIWYPQLPPSSSSSSLPAPGSGYPGHQPMNYWPNQGMYAGAFSHYPAQHPAQPQLDGKGATEHAA